MAEDRTSQYWTLSPELVTNKKSRAGYLLCPGPLVKLTSLVPGERVLIPTSYQWYHCVWRYQPTQCITVQRQTITILIVWAAWKVNYSLGMFEHGMSYDCDAGSCYQPRDNTWHVTQTLRDANTSVIYGNNPRVRRSGPRAGTNEGRAGTQHPSRPQGLDASTLLRSCWRPQVRCQCGPFGGPLSRGCDPSCDTGPDSVVTCLAPGARVPPRSKYFVMSDVMWS